MPAGDPKHRAGRFDEGLKLAATLANSLSIATFVIPIAHRDLDVLSDGGWTLLAAGGALRLLAQAVLPFMRAEDCSS